MRPKKPTHRALYVATAIGAISAIAFFARQRAARAARIPSPKPEASMPDSAPHTLSPEQLEALFGAMRWEPVAGDDSAIRIDPGWKSANLVQVEIPQLQGVAGAPADRRVTAHRAIAEQLAALFAAWEAAGLLPLVLSWDGSFAERRIRGGKSASRHAYGIAFDINARWNPLGQSPAPQGAKGSVRELVALANAHGFQWGGAWQKRPDGMHFEAFRAAATSKDRP